MEAEDLEWQLHSREKWSSGCSNGSAWAAGTDPYDRSAFELSMTMWGPSKFGNLSAGGFWHDEWKSCLSTYRLDIDEAFIT